MARELGWSQQRMTNELVAYQQEIDATQQFRKARHGQPNDSDPRPTRHAPRPS
jgi:hypothetical protein